MPGQGERVMKQGIVFNRGYFQGEWGKSIEWVDEPPVPPTFEERRAVVEATGVRTCTCHRSADGAVLVINPGCRVCNAMARLRGDR